MITLSLGSGHRSFSSVADHTFIQHFIDNTEANETVLRNDSIERVDVEVAYTIDVTLLSSCKLLRVKRFFIFIVYGKHSRTMNNSAYSDFYARALIKGISYEINSQGETMKRPASSTRFQICNLPPLELPTAVDNFVYVRITNIEDMEKFFGTLERNRFLLDNLQKILDDVKLANCKSLFDPALGEIVLAKIGERFVRGCVMCKTHFMTCTTYLIDSGHTMEIGLDQLYVIDEQLLKIPPQAFLMLLDVDIEEPLISNDELNEAISDSIVAFRLKHVSENGEAFVGTMIIRNQNGEIHDIGNILLEGIQAVNASHENNKDPAYTGQIQDAAVCFNHVCDLLLSDKDDHSEHSEHSFAEDERSVISLCSSDSEKGEKTNDRCPEKQLVSAGSYYRAIRIPTENSGPGLFYLHFLNNPDGFEDLQIYSTSLCGKYNNIWHRLLLIPNLQRHVRSDGEFVQVSSIVGSDAALFCGSEQVDEELKNRLKATFACRLSHSAPKPFNNNRYSDEAKLYFTENFMTNQIFDVYIAKVSRRYVLEVEIFLPGGESLFDILCKLDFAQHRWTWKVPSYNLESINEGIIVQRTDDEDDVHTTFTVQIGNKRNDLIEFQRHLKPGEHVLRNPEIGDICIVECEGQLFRCEIVDTIDGKKSFIINYVDYGEEQELDGDSLYSVDNQEEIIFETPVFGIKCRLGEIDPAGRGLDVRTGSWSRKALKVINSVVPLNKEFRAFIGPSDSSGVHPIQIVDKTLSHNDLATTLVFNDLAVYRHCNYYSSTIDLLPMKNFKIQYLNVEDGIIYGIPSTFETLLKDCQNYLEKVCIYDLETCKKDAKGIILYKNKYRRVIKLHEKSKHFGQIKEKYFLVDEGKIIEFYRNSQISSMTSFFALRDAHAAFFLRTCPALAVGFVLRGEKLTTKHEELLKNICSGKENVYLNNDVYSVRDITFTDGTSLLNLLDDDTELLAIDELPPISKLLSVDKDNLSRDHNHCENDSVCCEDVFSNLSMEYEIDERKMNGKYTQ
ncbi:Tudor domain family protein [Acanthocheilonema viteae]